MKVRFAPQAERQLAEIRTFISDRDPAAAVRVLTNIQAAVKLLTDFPNAGRIGAIPSTREWVVPGLPYIIVYRVNPTAGELAVIGVVHGARRRAGH